MKTEKQKQHIKEIEKPSSTEEVDMMETYTDRPVRGQVSTSVLAYDVTSCI